MTPPAPTERPQGTPASERELRAQGRRTMDRLLDAGTRVLAERGYHAVRVDDIVRAARTSHGTFYLYVANKEDLVRALAEECAAEMTRLAGELGGIDAGPAGWEAVRAWLGRFNATYRRYAPVIRAWMEEQVADRELVRVGARAFQDIAAKLVERIGESGAGHVPNPELAAAALLGMVERVNYYVLSRDIELDDETTLDTLATMIHRGFFGARA